MSNGTVKPVGIGNQCDRREPIARLLVEAGCRPVFGGG